MRTARRAYWVCQLAGWGIYFAFTLVQLLSEGETPFNALVGPLAAALIGVALTHGARETALQAHHLQRKTAGQLLLRVLLSSTACTVLHVGALVLVEAQLVERSWADTAVAAAYAVFRWLLVFFTWHALYVGFALVTARAELERAHEAARLRTLEAALNPHFLFNALNTVRALINIDVVRADEAVTRLARLLRSSLDVERAGLVDVEQELDVVDDYLAIERLRLDERLVVEREVATDALHRRLPAMLLQILVENAIVHGIARLPAGGTMRLVVQVREGALFIEVDNPRAPDRVPGAGTGLQNARERLHLLCGPQASLTLELSERAARARLVVPT